jgi:hypothetical protein
VALRIVLSGITFLSGAALGWIIARRYRSGVRPLVPTPVVAATAVVALVGMIAMLAGPADWFDKFFPAIACSLVMGSGIGAAAASATSRRYRTRASHEGRPDAS